MCEASVEEKALFIFALATPLTKGLRFSPEAAIEAILVKFGKVVNKTPFDRSSPKAPYAVSLEA